MSFKDSFPPATARALFITAQDFADDLQQYKRFFFYRGEVLTNPEVYFAAKFTAPAIECEEQIFERVTLQANGKAYPFYISCDNIKYVVPIVQDMIDKKVREKIESVERTHAVQLKALNNKNALLESELHTIRQYKLYKLMFKVEVWLKRFRL